MFTPNSLPFLFQDKKKKKKKKKGKAGSSSSSLEMSGDLDISVPITMMGTGGDGGFAIGDDFSDGSDAMEVGLSLSVVVVVVAVGWYGAACLRVVDQRAISLTAPPISHRIPPDPNQEADTTPGRQANVDYATAFITELHSAEKEARYEQPPGVTQAEHLVTSDPVLAKAYGLDGSRTAPAELNAPPAKPTTAPVPASATVGQPSGAQIVSQVTTVDSEVTDVGTREAKSTAIEATVGGGAHCLCCLDLLCLCGKLLTWFPHRTLLSPNLSCLFY